MKSFFFENIGCVKVMLDIADYLKKIECTHSIS